MDDVLRGRLEQREVEARHFRRQLALLDGTHAHRDGETGLDSGAHQLAITL